LVAEKGCDPLEYLINLLTVDVVEEIEIDAQGNEKYVKRPMTHQTKIDVAKTVVNYCYPRLTAKEVSGPDGGPTESVKVTADLQKLMHDPEAVEAAQRLALSLANQPTRVKPAIEAPAQPLDDITERAKATLEIDLDTGHWRPR
jgi:hypothetical protein